jgi:hypothetical protein
MGSRQRRLGAAVAVVVTFTSADGVALVSRIYGDGATASARFSSSVRIVSITNRSSAQGSHSAGRGPVRRARG